MENKTPEQIYKVIEKSSSVLVTNWVINNLLGLLSILLAIYLIWGRWHMGILGILVLVANVGFVNGFLLPTIFGIINQPFAEKARSGAIELEDIGIIDVKLSQTLSDTKVEYWPKYIVQGLSEENIKKIFPKYEK